MTGLAEQARRRRLLFACAATPALAACASDLSRLGDEPPAVVARRFGVCAAVCCTLRGGIPSRPVAVSGCDADGAVAPDAVFQAASLTKIAIAYATLRLAQDRRIDLAAPVSRYLPDGYRHRRNPFAGPADTAADHVQRGTLDRIPVATLLDHSAGLPNWTRSALVPEFDPGSRWQYSGEGYLLLQSIITAVTGQDIETTMARLVFAPLGLRRTRLRMTDELRTLAVHGTSWFGRRAGHEFVEPNGAASMVTTAGDFATLMAAWFADRALLAMAIAAPVPVDPRLGLAWGRGWGIESGDAGPVLWQWGSNPGFRAFAMMSATSGDGFALLTNSERGLALAPGLARSTLPGEHRVFRFPMLG